MSGKKVSFAETLTIKVGSFLRREYPSIAFASSGGTFIQDLSQGKEIGLLDASSAPPLGWMQKIFRRPVHSRRFMGVLWFSNKARNANYNNWVLEMYGTQDIDFLREVAERLAQEFRTSVHLKQVSEGARYEAGLSDYDE